MDPKKPRGKALSHVTHRAACKGKTQESEEAKNQRKTGEQSRAESGSTAPSHLKDRKGTHQ